MMPAPIIKVSGFGVSFPEVISGSRKKSKTCLILLAHEEQAAILSAGLEQNMLEIEVARASLSQNCMG